MTWQCGFIDHGVSIFPDGRIRPCCQIEAEYSKPISDIANPNRFSDLKKINRPQACSKCWKNEDLGIPSYRGYTSAVVSQPTHGIKYLDFRHSNQCNLKCRYCNPHFSNQWAKELNHQLVLKKTSVDLDTVITSSLRDVYWCGGEPLIMKDHYDFLNKAIETGFSKNISLRYNTNLTVLTYKDVDIVELWKKFKSVSVSISIDAIGAPLEYIRSGCKWLEIEDNIKQLFQICKNNSNIFLNFAPTVSILNLWFLPELFEYAENKKIKTSINILTGPDYLSLWAVPVQIQPDAIKKLTQIQHLIPDFQFNQMMQMLTRDDNEYLFLHAIRHILLLDNIRHEHLFDLLPFKNLAIDLTLKNYEYE